MVRLPRHVSRASVPLIPHGVCAFRPRRLCALLPTESAFKPVISIGHSPPDLGGRSHLTVQSCRAPSVSCTVSPLSHPRPPCKFIVTKIVAFPSPDFLNRTLYSPGVGPVSSSLV